MKHYKAYFEGHGWVDIYAEDYVRACEVAVILAQELSSRGFAIIRTEI